MARGKKAQKTQAPAPEPEPEVEPEVQEQEEEVVEQVTADEKMLQIITDIESLARIVRGLASDLKKVRRAFAKEHRALEKAAKGKKKRTRDPNAPPRAPSGFNKPGPLSKELCKFLKVPVGTELSRPDVTKRLTQYIKAHNLQNEENKREILPDKYMAKLLSGPTDGTPLTFFNLQRYIKHHFPKPAEAKK